MPSVMWQYKINSIPKNGEAEREIRETSPFMIATNSIKYLGGNPNQGSERSI